MKRQETEIAGKLRKLRIRVTVAVVLSLAIVLLAPSPPLVGVTYETTASKLPRLPSDFATVPRPVVEDAARSAEELFGDYPVQYDAFVNQLLSNYLETRDKDFIMVFNSGGWGWNSLEPTTEWYSILNGIKSELDNFGYQSLLLTYGRTEQTVRGYLAEFIGMATNYPSKAKELASRLNFLTRHNPRLKVIVTGESTGTVISDSVMSILQDNPQVYSIQTGPPFWHRGTWRDRTLVLTNNGFTPDTFSRGDIFTMFATSWEDFFGFSRAEGKTGNVLYYVGAPGHDYRWQYHDVYSQIAGFIRNNFGIQ